MGEGNGRAAAEVMKWAAYLFISMVAFLTGTTGSDVFARTHIATETFDHALAENLHWASVQWMGSLMLFAPFLAVAVICAAVQGKVRTSRIAAIFGTGMLALMYFYFEAHQAAQRAVLEQHWTAASLTVGLLPFVPGIPIFGAVLVAAAVATHFETRRAG
jgi:hypothetical protein